MQKLALLTGLLLASTAAAKADVFLLLQEAGVNGGVPTQVGAGALVGGIATASFSTPSGSPYGLFAVTVTGTQQSPPGTGGLTLDATSINIDALGAGSITVFVFSDDNTVVPSTFQSSFTTNLLTGTSVAMSTRTVSGAGFGGPTLSSFTAVAGDLTNVGFAPSLFGAPYSLTAEFTFNATAAGQQANSTIDIAAVPGPVVGAGLPGLVASFLGGGWFWRRRKQAA